MPGTQDVVDQLAGRDIAVILGVALVLMTLFMIGVMIYLLRTQGANERMIHSIGRMAGTIRKRTDSDIIQTDAIQQLVTSNIKRTEVADRAYQEIFRLAKLADEFRPGLTEITTKVSTMPEVVEELRKIGIDLLTTARNLEQSARNLEDSHLNMKALAKD